MWAFNKWALAIFFILFSLFYSEESSATGPTQAQAYAGCMNHLAYVNAYALGSGLVPDGKCTLNYPGSGANGEIGNYAFESKSAGGDNVWSFYSFDDRTGKNLGQIWDTHEMVFR